MDKNVQIGPKISTLLPMAHIEKKIKMFVGNGWKLSKAWSKIE